MESKRRFIALLGLAAVFAGYQGAAIPMPGSSAVEDPFQIILSEGSGSGVNAITGTPLYPFSKTATAPETWVFTLPQNVVIGPWDVYILDPNGAISDVLRFSDSDTSPDQPATVGVGHFVWLFSQGSPYLPTAVPVGFPYDQLVVQETNGEAFYALGSYPSDNEYTIISDVPDGSLTIVLFGFALLGIEGLRRRLSS